MMASDVTIIARAVFYVMPIYGLSESAKTITAGAKRHLFLVKPPPKSQPKETAGVDKKNGFNQERALGSVVKYVYGTILMV